MNRYTGRSEKDRVFDMLESIIEELEKELHRAPTAPEILTRLALLFGTYAGGAAKNSSDPEGFIFRAIQPISPTAHAVLRELKQPLQLRTAKHDQLNTTDCRGTDAR